MKKMMKVISIFICIVMMINVGVYAFGVGDINPGNQSQNADTAIKQMGNNALGIIQVVGIVLSVLMLIVIGIKYMLGSTEEKAEYKKSLMPYVIGAAIVFTGSMIPNIIYNIANGL